MVRAVANPPQAVGGAGKAAEVSPVERSSQPPPVAHTLTNSKQEVLKTANREAGFHPIIMNETKRTPLGDRYMLTVREAAEYFGIGEHKLRDLLDKNPEKNLSVWNGNRQLIRRKRLEEYLDDCDSI